MPGSFPGSAWSPIPYGYVVGQEGATCPRCHQAFAPFPTGGPALAVLLSWWARPPNSGHLVLT
jgi:hypothetical protein